MTPAPRRPVFLLLSALPMVVAFRASGGSIQAAKTAKPVESGARLFAQRCAPCHGALGVGGPGFKKPLRGSRSASALSAYVAKSMPPGQGTPIAQAEKIAAYMQGAFYARKESPKVSPPRVALSRLTVKQYRNAVADLVTGFRPCLPGPVGGLRGEYYKARGGDRQIDRVDATVDFDFGPEGPEAGKFDPNGYTVAWTGSLVAPDTGEYELIVRSDQGIRLWFNGGEKPLIDAWVKSGKETEFVGTTTLLGGRAYPLRLEFTKATQGVNDDAAKKGKAAPPSFVRLLWRRLRRVPEVVPARDLCAASAPRVYTVATPFPPDDRSMGYERGADVSTEWDEATTAAALDAAHDLASHTGVRDDAPDRGAKLRAVCRDFVERAFRRPLTPEVVSLYVDRQFEKAPTPDEAVKRVVVLTLKSPRFLFRDLGTKDAWTVAEDLSFGLWDTLPDPELRRAAASGELASRDGVAKQATRMAADPRAWTKLRDFLLLWLKVDEVPDLVKSAKRYPTFDATVAADLRTSLELFLEANGGDYQKLMLSPTVYLDGRLSKLYGGGLPDGAPFQAVKDQERAGVLTQPYMMARLGYLDGSDPIHRGVLVVRNMLGRVLAPPPAAFAPLAASAHPNFSTRERVAFQTKPTACAGCHGLINPIGFSFERYDAIGRIRTTDAGKPIDSSGGYGSARFADARDLARYLAASGDSHRAFVEKLFLHVVKQPPLAYGPGTIPGLQRSFEQEGYDVRRLMASIATAASGVK